jgi:predicted nucleotidyltransferase
MKTEMAERDSLTSAPKGNSFGLTDRDMTTFKDIFKKYPDVKTVFIFGSRAKNSYKPGSDIDLAVMNEAIIRKINVEFEESSLPYRVELLDYHTLKHVDLKSHIDRVGIVFYQDVRNP